MRSEKTEVLLTQPNRLLQELRESEKRFRRLLEATTDYIYRVTLENGRCVKTEYGLGCEAVTGYTPLEFETFEFLWYQIIHEEDRAAVEKQIDRILRGEEPPPLEHRIIRKDRSIRWIRNTPIPHRNEGGHLIAYDGVITDITPRKHAEEMLRTPLEVGRELEEAPNLSEGMIGVLRAICAILLWDYAAYWTLDAKAGNLRCQAAWLRCSPGPEGYQDPRPSRILAKGAGLPGWVLATSRPVWIPDLLEETEVVRASLPGGMNLRCGCAFPVRVYKELSGVIEFFSREIWEKDPHMEEVISGAGTQIGEFIERKSAEEALRQSQERLALVIEGSNDGIWDWDLITNETYFSPRWKEMLGYHNHEVENTFAAWEGLIHPEDRAKAAAQLKAYCEGGSPNYELEHRLKHKSGGYRWILARGVAQRDASGKPVRMAGSHVDLTERKVAAERLENANAELARRERVLRRLVQWLRNAHARLKEAQDHLIQAARFESIGTLAAGVSHEVKNPLQTVLMGLHYLSQRFQGADEDLILTLSDMREAVSRANTIVGELLNMSSLKSIQMIPEDLNGLLEHWLHLIRNQMDASQITVVTRLAAGLPRVLIDRNQIHQVFINLFINAKQAMPDGGALTVATRLVTPDDAEERRRPHFQKFKPAQTLVVAEVLDTGTGIKEEHLGKIFDPFFSTKPPGEGTGLGLSIVRRIIDLHDGAIEIANAPGGGVVATVILKANGEGEL
jgi:PAS domain S-box-containing protein